MNLPGALIGGISVAFALVEILPPDLSTPPDGSPAVPMLVSIFASALLSNVPTWFFAIPNSSSHCVIGSLTGVAASDALLKSRNLAKGVGWHQIITVLKALAVSPLLGFVVAGGLYWILRMIGLDRGKLRQNPHAMRQIRAGSTRAAASPR
jgi:PiT family inorganic phosphate transporter